MRIFWKIWETQGLGFLGQKYLTTSQLSFNGEGRRCEGDSFSYLIESSWRENIFKRQCVKFGLL